MQEDCISCINRRKKKELYIDSNTHNTQSLSLSLSLSLSHTHTHTRTHTKPHSQTNRKQMSETRKGHDQGPQKPLPNRHPELGLGTTPWPRQRSKQSFLPSKSQRCGQIWGGSIEDTVISMLPDGPGA